MMTLKLQKSWRWFGEDDPIKLSDLKQMGVEGVVTALHHIPNGEVWPKAEIQRVKDRIEAHGMKWSVVESLPVTEALKLHGPKYDEHIENYQLSLKNLGECGIQRVCYNFMPVLDWARTHLHHKLPNGGEVMLFDYPTFVAFDVYILKREGAKNDYADELLAKAKTCYSKMTAEQQELLSYNIIVKTQGFIDGTVNASDPAYQDSFMKGIEQYKHLNADGLRHHLALFLHDIIPVAEKYGIKMCIHPDDPPFPVLGMPRIVSTAADFEWILNAVDSPSNGLTFCTGSLSLNPNNDLVHMVKQFSHKIHFAHLRNNSLLNDQSFHELGHIDGDVPIVPIVKTLLLEQQRRAASGEQGGQIPFRPDHGIKMLDDFTRDANPGYPLVGRLKGLAEIDGVQTAIQYLIQN